MKISTILANNVAPLIPPMPVETFTIMKVELEKAKALLDKLNSEAEEIIKANGLTDEYFEKSACAKLISEAIDSRIKIDVLTSHRRIADEEVKRLKKDKADFIEKENERLNRANGILEAVKAMLQHGGGTHRQRDFYDVSLIRMIDNVKGSIRCVEQEDNNLQF